MTTDEKIKEFEQAMLNLFPGISTTHFKYGNEIEGKDFWNSIHFNIPPENESLVKSPYFYNRKTIVHFSNILALNSIIQEQAVRLYNLNNLNDPREFTYASKIFRLKEPLISNAKDNLFLMSFCERSILGSPSDEFNMWRLYGKNGKGLAIIFSIANDPAKWMDFHISKIVYGADQRKKFSKLLNLLENMNQTGPEINVDFGKLYAFHKSKLFEIEKEVRIVCDRRDMRTGRINKSTAYINQPIFPIIKSDLYKLVENGSNIRYLKLPLYKKSQEYYDPEIPLLRIEEIKVGYNFVNEVQDLIKTLGELCVEYLGYRPLISQTRLKNFYWDIEKRNKLYPDKDV